MDFEISYKISLKSFSAKYFRSGGLNSQYFLSTFKINSVAALAAIKSLQVYHLYFFLLIDFYFSWKNCVNVNV